MFSSCNLNYKLALDQFIFKIWNAHVLGTEELREDYSNHTITSSHMYFYFIILSSTTNIRLGTLPMSCRKTVHLKVKSEDLTEVFDSTKK